MRSTIGISNSITILSCLCLALTACGDSDATSSASNEGSGSGSSTGEDTNPPGTDSTPTSTLPTRSPKPLQPVGLTWDLIRGRCQSVLDQLEEARARVAEYRRDLVPATAAE